MCSLFSNLHSVTVTVTASPIFHGRYIRLVDYTQQIILCQNVHRSRNFGDTSSCNCTSQPSPIRDCPSVPSASERSLPVLRIVSVVCTILGELCIRKNMRIQASVCTDLWQLCPPQNARSCHLRGLFCSQEANNFNIWGINLKLLNQIS